MNQSTAGPAADRVNPGPGVIDVHSHVVPSVLLTDLAAGRTRFPHVEVRSDGERQVVSFNGGTPTRPVVAGLTDADLRATWLADQGIDYQVVGGWLDIVGYDLPADEGAEWAQALTEAITDVAGADDRLIPLGTVPLQDPHRAATALLDQHQAGIPGVMIATRAAGRELDDPAYTPFWEAADEAGAVIYLHPAVSPASARYDPFDLGNGLARLEDSTVTVARLLYAGIPARFPRMKLVVAHGGAAIPYVLGRLARNHVLTKVPTADPVESFARLYFDSVVLDPAALTFLVAKAGADHVLLGSDYPHPIGDLTPRAVVEHAELETDIRDAILGGTAAQLFGKAPDLGVLYP